VKLDRRSNACQGVETQRKAKSQNSQLRTGKKNEKQPEFYAIGGEGHREQVVMAPGSPPTQLGVDISKVYERKRSDSRRSKRPYYSNLRKENKICGLKEEGGDIHSKRP